MEQIGDTGGIMGRTWRSAVAVNSDKEPTFYYLARNDIFGYALARIAGSGNFEITDTATPTRRYRARANRRPIRYKIGSCLCLRF